MITLDWLSSAFCREFDIVRRSFSRAISFLSLSRPIFSSTMIHRHWTHNNQFDSDDVFSRNAQTHIDRQREKKRRRKETLFTSITNNYEMSICWKEDEEEEEEERKSLHTCRSIPLDSRHRSRCSTLIFLASFFFFVDVSLNKIFISNHWFVDNWTRNDIDLKVKKKKTTWCLSSTLSREKRVVLCCARFFLFAFTHLQLKYRNVYRREREEKKKSIRSVDEREEKRKTTPYTTSMSSTMMWYCSPICPSGSDRQRKANK